LDNSPNNRSSAAVHSGGTLGNFPYFKDAADGCHRTRDIGTRTVARKSQNLRGDAQMDAVQPCIGRNNSCKNFKNIPFIGIHTTYLFVCIPLLLAIILRVSFFLNDR